MSTDMKKEAQMSVLKIRYKNCDKEIDRNNEKLEELRNLQKQIESKIQKLEDANLSLQTDKIKIGLDICQVEGHISDWQESHIEDGNVVCECKRCKSLAKIKL